MRITFTALFKEKVNALPADVKNTSKDYFLYYARPDGTMLSYDENLVSMTGFITKTQGLDQMAASNAAREMMAKLPAWQNMA